MLRPAHTAPCAVNDSSRYHSSAEGARSLVCTAAGGHFGFQFGAFTDNAARSITTRAFWSTLARVTLEYLLIKGPAHAQLFHITPPCSLLSEVVRIPLIASDSAKCSFRHSGECDSESLWRLHITVTSLQVSLRPQPHCSNANTYQRSPHPSVHYTPLPLIGKMPRVNFLTVSNLTNLIFDCIKLMTDI